MIDRYCPTEFIHCQTEKLDFCDFFMFRSLAQDQVWLKRPLNRYVTIDKIQDVIDRKDGKGSCFCGILHDRSKKKGAVQRAKRSYINSSPTLLLRGLHQPQK